jgi:protein PhnA
MSRRREAHQAHQQAVAALGKNLSRRAGSVCELCNGDRELRVFEVAPLGEDPCEEAAILACVRCRELSESKRLPSDASELRFLEGTVWAEALPVRVAAIQLLRRLEAEGVAWARECLEALWIDDEVEERLQA